MADKETKSSDTDKPTTMTKEGVVQPRTGGVTSAPEDTTPHDPFATTGDEPVRDREPDTSKGTPVTRFFTKDGTPVEPSTVPPAVTPSNLAGQDPDKRDDVVAVVEYLDESGSTVTHDSLKARREEEKKAKS